MESDTFLIISGLGLTCFALAMWGIYLLRADSMLLDAISLGWLGHIIWVGIAVTSTGIFYPQRSWAEAKYGVVVILIVGTIGYAMGLHMRTGAAVLSRFIPTPQDNISVLSVWVLLIVSAIIHTISWTLIPVFPQHLIPVIGAVNTGTLGAMGVFSILLMTAFRQAWISRVVGLAGFIAALGIFLATEFSRRPVPALIGAFVGVLYHLHVRMHGRLARLAFLGAGAFTLLFSLSFLSATRVERHFGFGRAGQIFSSDTAMSLLGASMGSIDILEFTYHHYPETYPYLWGSGMAPAFLFWIPRGIWPGKPIASGGVISPQYLGHDSYNVANTIFGELFMNFTAWGVLPGMFVLGMVVAAINQKLHEQQHNLTLWLAWFIVVPDFLSEWRGDFTSMTVQALLRVAIFLGMTWLLGKLMPSRPRLEIGAFTSGAPLQGASRRPLGTMPRPRHYRPDYARG